MTLQDIDNSLKEQQKHQNELLTKLMDLVEKSATATSAANVLNTDLKNQLSGIKKRSWFDILSQISQALFYVAIIFLVAYSVFLNKPIKIGNIVDIGSTPAFTASTTTPR